MSEEKWYTLVKTCRATGVVGKFTNNHPDYDKQHRDLMELLHVSAGELIGRLMETRDPNAPPVATAGFLYRYEA